MTSIILNKVSFYYDSPYAKIFEGVSLSVDSQWKTGLIGRNGRGKTTLLNLIHKEVTPSGGQMEIPVETSFFPYVPDNGQQVTLEVIKDSVAPFRQWERQMEVLLKSPDDENLKQYGEIAERYERLGGYEIESSINKEANGIGLGSEVLQRRFSTLSGGEQTRALIIALFLRRGQFFLLDEPTNHLDIKGRISLSEYLAGKQGFILVSHDRHFLDSCVDHVLSIDRHDVRLIQGNYSEWKYQKEIEDEFEKRKNERLTREIRSLKKAAGRRRIGASKKESEKKGRGAVDRGYIGHKSAKQMKRALNIERRIKRNIEDKKELFRNYEKDRRLKIQVADKAPATLLNISNCSIKIGQRTIIDNFSLSLTRGQRIAIIGENGCGKTTLFNAISGEIEPSSGIIHIPGNLAVIRAYQQPLWNSGYLRRYLLEEKIDETYFRQILGVLGVEGDVFDQPLETFSQGQLKKVDLCRSFVSPAHLFLWDEPVNYIDIMSREQIEKTIMEIKPSMLFIEHDKYLIDKIATDVVTLDSI